MIFAFLNIGTPELIILFIALVIVTAITAIVFRFILSISQRNKLMKQQVQLLEEIAKANNVPADRISGIQNENR